MVLFIPGVYAGPINYLFNTYFKPQFEYLKQNKISYTMSRASSEDIITNNAKCLRDQILDLNEKVTIITHSKGGVDIYEALRLYPEIKTKIRKIICMQAPFYGSPVADLLTNTFFGRIFCFWSLKMLRGHAQCIHEIRTDLRGEYMKKYDPREVLKDVDILLISAHKPRDAKKRIDTCLFLFRNWMLKSGINSDGLVPFSSSQIKGFPVQEFDNLDHASAVVVRTPLKFDTMSFNELLFSHLINQGS